ncbi:nucleolar protein 4 [Acrasis kona]|uniref:Nucleolar protein 4 n=1 Tax=Acrasis kona TaxID=1008807 RepID=A0AAW2ZKC9_9EUKA
MAKKKVRQNTDCTIFVGNLPKDVKEEDLRQFIELKVGSVSKVIIIRDKETQESKQYGFVEFLLSIKVDEAIKNLNKKEWKGQILHVKHYGGGATEEKKPEKKDPKEFREQVKQLHQIMVTGIDKKLSISKAVEKLKEEFEKIGKINNIRVPRSKKKNQHHDGYGFIEYSKEKHAKAALQTKHGKLSCTQKLSREEYLQQKEEKKQNRRVENELKKKQQMEQDDDEDDENDEDDQDDEESESEQEREPGDLLDSSDDDGDQESIQSEQDEEELERIKQLNEARLEKRRQDDLKRTIFIKNLPYEIDKISLQDLFQDKFGPVQYVAPVIPDKSTQLSNGTAFLKFKFKDAMDKLLQELELSSKLNHIDHQDDDKQHQTIDGLELDGRQLIIQQAIDKQQAESIKKQQANQSNKDKDVRNLYLMMEGHISNESEAAKTMPPSLLNKIQFNFQQKKKKLQNPIFHISKTRLSVHNIPKTMTDKELKALFVQHASKAQGIKEQPVVIQCKIVKEKDPNMKNVTLDQSKGFGFVEFTKHEHALCALREINNNPTLFGDGGAKKKKKMKMKKGGDPEANIDHSRRLMVEFAVENTMKLHLLKQRMLKSNRTKQDKEEMKRQLESDYRVKKRGTKRKIDQVGGKKKKSSNKRRK